MNYSGDVRQLHSIGSLVSVSSHYSFISSGVTSYFGSTTELDTNNSYRVIGNISSFFNPSSKVNAGRIKTIPPRLRHNIVSYPSGDCPIAAISLPGFSPNNIINIIDKSDSFFENTPEYHKDELIAYSDNGFYSGVYYPYNQNASGKIDFLVTDKVLNRPLYFQYQVRFDVRADSLLSTLQIYKNNEELIDQSQYILEFNYNLFSEETINDRYDRTLTWGNIDKEKQDHRVRILLDDSFINENDFYVVKYNKVNGSILTPHSELLEIKNLYEQNIDYNVLNGVYIPQNSFISKKTNLYIKKDPRRIIKNLGITQIKENSYQTDQTSSWYLRINKGSFLTHSGYWNNSPSGLLYKTINPLFQNETPFVISSVKPRVVSSNILKVEDVPITIDDVLYSYPNYEIPFYDKHSFDILDNPGKISVDINGVQNSGVKIRSIDREKGYIMLDTELQAADEIELTFYADGSKYIVVDNFQLNPKMKNGGEDFHISGHFNGFGLAILPYKESDPYSKLLWMYDPATELSTRTYTCIPPVGQSSLYPSGTLTGNNNFFNLCEVNINAMSSNLIRVDDARVIGGGVTSMKTLNEKLTKSKVDVKESSWYSDIGYLDGEPLPNNSNIIIHIPRQIINNLINRWISNGSYQPNSQLTLTEWAEVEVKHYINQTIRRYISAGSDYILVDENFKRIFS